MKPFAIDGVVGYDVLYDWNGVDYYQARLRFARGQVVTCIAQCEQSSKIALKENPSLQALLQTIRME